MLIGGFFLAKMGYAMLKGGITTLKQTTPLDGIITQVSKNYFLLGLYTHLANPKTVIYFSSVFSLALRSTAGMNLKPQLAVIIFIQTLLVFSLLMMIMSIPKIEKFTKNQGVILIFFLVFFLIICLISLD